jgi:hypothetical protein
MIMAKRPTGRLPKRSPRPEKTTKTNVCDLPPVPEREFASGINPFRASLIRLADKKWVNGTVLHYYFFDRPSDGPGGRWRADKRQCDAVRKAFAEWKRLPIGLEFKAVSDREDAEIRIGFDRFDGSWSYVGRDVVDIATDPNERTMNFGWDLTTPYGHDTALHEIGHTLGFPHEHQNPNAGIVWDEDAVLRHFRGPPNRWSDQQINWNILRKLPPGSVAGSAWDPNSIMHYDFEPGLIATPEKYAREGLSPEPGLSKVDIGEAKSFYPALSPKADPELIALESRRLQLKPGQQVNFRIKPTRTRNYNIQTFGASDSVMVLFQKTSKDPRYMDGDDDSAYDHNARIEAKLYRGKEYILRVRLYYAEAGGEMAVFMW